MNDAQMQQLDEFSWSDSVVREAREAESITVGIVNASRLTSDARTLFELLSSLTQSMQHQKLSRRVLCVCLNLEQHSENNPTHVPVPQRSPVGGWSTVAIPVSSSEQKTWEEDQLSSWLALWKEAFPIILIDLGPMDSRASKVIGRLTDGNYLLLGPHGCGSAQWILHQMASHQQHGSTICASLIANAEFVAKPEARAA